MSAQATQRHNKPVAWVIGDWQYWPDACRLQKGTKEQRLTSQQNQVLCLLVKAAPQVVSREQFMDQVWAGKIVNEDALSRTIAELRKALGDSASQARYIKTIPKKGYQLHSPPEPLTEQHKRQGRQLIMLLLLMVAGGLSWWALNHQSLSEQLVLSLANASRLTADPGMEQHSQLSADGSQLRFVKNGRSGSQIVIRSVRDANQQQLIELPRHRLASPVQFSGDQRVFFTARDQQHCYLKSHNLTTGLFTDWGSCVFNGESRLLNGDEATGWLLFSAWTDEDDRVAVFSLDPASGARQQLTRPADSGEQDWSGQLSPDGNWLSFSRGNQSVRNLWLRNMASGTERPITSGEHYSVSHQWLDEAHIIYDSDVNGSRQLWLLNIDDLSTTPLGGYGAQHPSVNQDRTLLSYQLVSYEANIWEYRVGEDSLTRLIHSNKYDNYPAFAPDGGAFVFSSNRQDLGSIWLYDRASATERLLLSLPDAKLTRPSWTADGQAVLMTVNDESGYWSLSYDLASESWQRLPFTHANHSAMAHQGSWYALARSAEVDQQVLVLTNGQQSVLPMQAVSRFSLLSDGRVVYTRSDADGLFVYHPLTRQSELLLADFPAAALNLWTTVNQSVYYDRGGSQAGTWRLDATTGEQVLITTQRAYSVGTSLAVDPQEQRLLLVRTDRAESDVFLAKLQE
jgi:DNA-binding winged helix-turn-helix (wHTH) protein/Tol biopolymer transport system component